MLPSVLFYILFAMCLLGVAFFSAVQIAFTSLCRKKPLFFIRLKPSFAIRAYNTFAKNASLSEFAFAIAFWLVVICYSSLCINEIYSLYAEDFAFYITAGATLVSFIFLSFLGIYAPARLAAKYPGRIWLVVIFPVLLLLSITYPLALFLQWLGSNINIHKNPFLFETLQLKPLLTETNAAAIAQAGLADVDQEIYQNAMEFNQLRVRDCMIPRTEIVAVEKNETLDIVKQHFISSGHSKLLVYKETIDDIIGYIHLIDMYRNPSGIDKILMPITIAPESMAAGELLKQLIDRRRSMAVVVDEFGGTSGMVTIEDLIEEIIGDIEDEHDVDDNTERKISDTEYIFSARLEIDYINETYNLNLPEGDYDTLGGLIFYVHQNIPKVRDVVFLPPFEFTILSTAKAKILDVKVRIITN